MRIPILWRFVVVLVVFLIIPIAIGTVVLQIQIQENFSNQIKQQMKNILYSFTSELESELSQIEDQLSKMSKSDTLIEILLSREKNSIEDSFFKNIDSFIDTNILIFNNSKNESFKYGKLSSSYNFFGNDLIEKSSGQVNSFLVIEDNSILTTAVFTQTIGVHSGYTYVIQKSIPTSAFQIFKNPFPYRLNIVSKTTGELLFTSESESKIYPGFQFYDKQAMLDFLQADPEMTLFFNEKENPADVRYSLSQKSSLPAYPNLVFQLSLPHNYSQPFDVSFYLIILSSISIILALISSTILVRRVVRPLSFLSTEVNKLRYRLRNAQETQALRLDTNDEISDVAYAFNGLVRDLLEGRHKIEEQRLEIFSYAQNLEERVLERTRQLEEAKIRAEIASNQKSRFLVNMNHELRTPLNSISGVTDLLRFGAYEKIESYSEKLLEISQLDYIKKNDINLSDFLNTLSQTILEEGSSKRGIASALEKTTNLENDPFIGDLDRFATEEENSILGAYNAIRDAGETLLNIINEVINLSRIESGVIEVKREKTKFVDIVSSVMIHADSYLRVKGKKKVLELSHSVDSRIPEYVEIDGQKIKQVFLNFMTNAIKYTKTGSIFAEVTYQPQQRTNFVRFTVTDTGIGIAEKDKSQLFLEFSRAFEVREIEGTGLGLALSRKLVERMGGSVGFESELGKGSTFWFTIPVGISNA